MLVMGARARSFMRKHTYQNISFLNPSECKLSCLVEMAVGKLYEYAAECKMQWNEKTQLANRLNAT